MVKFSRNYVEQQLNELGWTLPRGVKYKRMKGYHAVQCLKCNWIHEKRLDNLIYREEKCPKCGEEHENTVVMKKLDAIEEALNDMDIKIEELTEMTMQQLDKNIQEIEMVLTEPEPPALGEPTALKKAFTKLISKSGFKKYKRRMQSDEWFNLSHEISHDLLEKFSTSNDEFLRWESIYTDILADHPNKQGQDILPTVIPNHLHKRAIKNLQIRMVQL